MALFNFGFNDNHSEYCHKHNQNCPTCKEKLICLECYIGGGSHYWILWCNDCRQRFTYDTYRFKLEEYGR